jgi:hypothetical protein
MLWQTSVMQPPTIGASALPPPTVSTYGFPGSSNTRPSGSGLKARWNHSFVSSVSSSLRRVKRVKVGP